MGTKYYSVWTIKNPDLRGQGFKGSQGGGQTDLHQEPQPAVKFYLHNGQQIPICDPPYKNQQPTHALGSGDIGNRTFI